MRAELMGAALVQLAARLRSLADLLSQGAPRGGHLRDVHVVLGGLAAELTDLEGLPLSALYLPRLADVAASLREAVLHIAGTPFGSLTVSELAELRAEFLRILRSTADILEADGAGLLSAISLPHEAPSWPSTPDRLVGAAIAAQALGATACGAARSDLTTKQSNDDEGRTA